MIKTNNIYELKKEFGKSIDIYKKSWTNNLVTGIRTLTRTKIHIRRAIVLPRLDTNTGNLIAQRAFERLDRPQPDVGGFIDHADKIIIIDQDDLPKGYQITIQESYVIIYEGKGNPSRYNIKSSDIYDFGEGIILRLRKTDGEELSYIPELKIRQKLEFHENVLKPGSQSISKNITSTLSLAQNINNIKISPPNFSPMITQHVNFNDGLNVLVNGFPLIFT